MIQINDKVPTNFYAEAVNEKRRGTTTSVFDAYGPRAARTFVGDARVHDANFAFLTTTLAKLHKELYEPKYFVTWKDDVPVDVGGGFVEVVEYYTVDWAGIMDANRNIVGNGVNYIPRVNGGLTQKKVNVYTYEVAYDLRFIELEKMEKLKLQKSIQDIYKEIIVAGWDLFVQEVAYTGIKDSKGLFNSDNIVLTTTIDNSATSGVGTEGLTDQAVVSLFNGIFETYFANSNMNRNIIPDTFLVPMHVMSDLVSRFSPLYSASLYEFILAHNLGVVQGKGIKITIEGRPALDDLNGGKGRIVAYRKDKSFVRIDLPFPMQHYITLPNIEKMAYTSAFVGQVSGIQLPYNTSNAELGIVTYWDFTTSK